MQRQRELAVQSANDTLTSTERKYLNDEFQELTKEIARIGKTTDYNGKNMLNWDEDPNKSFGAMGNADGIKAAIDAETRALTTISGSIALTANQNAANSVITAITTYTTAIDAAWGAYNTSGDATTRDTAINTAKTNLETALTNFDTAITASTNEKDTKIMNDMKDRLGILTKDNQAIDGLTGLYARVAGSSSTEAASYTLHVGANYSTGIGGKWGNEMTVTYVTMNPAALGLTTKHIKSQNGATEAIDQLDKIIKSVSGVRAKIGTFINRLEYTINNIANLEFNTQDAESRIRDTDFAKETTNFTRNQIMVQSSVSMLAQANSLPQSVLGLIG
jgi:flagellin